MTRAINVTASEDDVMTRCAEHGVSVSSIETLASGGTRVVLNTGEAAAAMRRIFRKELLTGEVKRTPFSSRSF